MHQLRSLPAAGVAAAALLACDLPAARADVVDVMVHHVFMTMSPVPGQGTPHTTINLGDTVRWTWHEDFHSVTSDAGLFDSDLQNSGFVFNHTFGSLGVFPYHCFVHGAPGGIGMAGTITVVPAPAAAALLPLVAAGALRRRRR